MSNYEGVFILDPDLAGDASKNAVTLIQELITKNGGRVENLQEWGKKRMAYKIKKRQDGHYVIMTFHLDPKSVKKVDQNLRLNDQVLRHMLVNKDN
jgi:small subunit ribosomal protein S6